MLITPDFFVGEINIPNRTSVEVQEKLSIFIDKYEELCLENLLGYEIYKSLLADPTTERMQKLINGDEFTISGRLTKWKGLVYTRSGIPAEPYVVGFTERPAEQIQVGNTTGFTANTNSVTFDGVGGKPDYRGYDLIVERAEYGIMISGIDYSFNKQTGEFTLLKQNDKFSNFSWYTFIFKTSPVSLYANITSINYFSLIAFYIYYFVKHDDAIWNSGIGTIVPKGDTAIVNSPGFKMNWAYNEFARQAKILVNYLYQNSDTFPEYDNVCINSAYKFCKTTNDFDI